MAPRYDVVCFSHLRWDYVYQRPQHLLCRWARGHRVFYVEEPDYAGDEPRFVIREPAPGVHVVSSHLPESVLEAGPAAWEALQRQLLDRLFAEQGIGSQVLWYYTPVALGYSDHLRPLATVYDCMDELAAFRGAPARLARYERELFARADVVFTGGRSLYDAKRQQHPRVYCFPSSVDLEHFARARAAMDEPADQRALVRPKLGFFGVIDERMDLELLDEVARRRPCWQLVLVGPVAKIDSASLPRRDNLHYLGQKPYDTLPSYLAAWDVALMPFARNAATRFISPTKTLEYLAAGKAVVSTAIPDVVQPYGALGLVRIADSVEAFVTAVEAALTEPAEVRLAAIDAMLAGTSWDRTWTGMAELVNEIVVERAGRPSLLPLAGDGQRSGRENGPRGSSEARGR